MADQPEPKARYPKAKGLQEGAKHGYIGDVEVYDPDEPGRSNTTTGKASKGDAKAVVGTVGVLKSDDTAADDTPGTSHQ